jgi:hypothetical protein
MKNEKVPGQFVTSVAVSEVLVSAGVQLVHWAHDIAFTDAAFGEDWSVETANRMATLSEILNIVFKRLPKDALSIVVDFPDGVVGQVAINPNYKPDAEKPGSKDAGDSDKVGGDGFSIDPFPF